MSEIACPFCHSTDVRIDQKRGSALCRTLYHCENCDEPFEEFG